MAKQSLFIPKVYAEQVCKMPSGQRVDYNNGIKREKQDSGFCTDHKLHNLIRDPSQIAQVVSKALTLRYAVMLMAFMSSTS